MAQKRIGILGGGQLAAMLIKASRALTDISISLLCEHDDEATRNHPDRVIAPLHAHEVVQRWADRQDVITFEHEHVDLNALAAIPGIESKLAPNARCVAISQDREKEKRCFESLGIPVAPWSPVPASTNTATDTATDTAPLLPGILKTATHGYDGKGQCSVTSVTQLNAALTQFKPHRCVLEKRIAFEREVSQVSVRDRSGRITHFPLVENTHRNGILVCTRAPFGHGDSLSLSIAQRAREYTERLASELSYVGVLAIEFFVVGEHLLANEWAPRVHNSGHWSIEGADISQFTAHVMAISDTAPASLDARMATTMWNIIGVPRSAAEAAIAIVQQRHPATKCYLHWYDKSPRPGRKVGHITITEPWTSDANKTMATLQDSLQALG